MTATKPTNSGLPDENFRKKKVYFYMQKEVTLCNNSVCPCMEPCPMKYAMGKIAGKWKIPIICALKIGGSTRYNELKRSVNGITNTMLASSLKELEADGLIERKEYLEVPVRVEYALTSNCKYLLEAFDALDKFSKHMLNK